MPPPSRTPADARPVVATEVFAAHSGRGAVELDAERVVLLPAEFIRQLHFAIVESHADNAQDVLYRTGFEWALQAMASKPPKTPPAATPTDVAALLNAWWEPLTRMGWGSCTFSADADQPGITHVELEHSAIAEALGSADDPVCHIYAGVFAGALSFVERVERHGVEMQCRARGAATCRFVVAPPAQVDVVETLRQQGVAPDEIIARLH